jgi:hypothetical protein
VDNNRKASLIGGVLLLAVVGLWVALIHARHPVNVPLLFTDGPVLPAPPAGHRLMRSRPPLAAAVPIPVAVTATNPSLPNAADLYRQTFDRLDALSDEAKETFRDWKDPVNPTLATELCTKLKPIVALADSAVGVTNCNWGLGESTEETPLVGVAKARGVARALLWHAAQCRAGNDPGAADDLEAALSLGQNISQSLVGYLVDLAIGSMAVDFVTAKAAGLDHDAQARLGKIFEAELYEELFYHAMELEAQKDARSADYYATLPAEKLQRLAAVYQSASGITVDQARLVAGYRQVSELEHQYVRVSQLTEAEFQDWLGKLHALQQTDPLIQFMCPDLGRLEEGTRAAVVKSAMVVAGLAVIQGGAGALPGHLDPTSGKAFTYREVGNGFELESAYQQKGRPIVLLFQTK